MFVGMSGARLGSVVLGAGLWGSEAPSSQGKGGRCMVAAVEPGRAVDAMVARPLDVFLLVIDGG